MISRRSLLAAATLAPLAAGCADTVRAFIYYPPARGPTLELAGGPQRITVQTEDGLALLGALYPPAPGRPVIVFFHGNASDLYSVAAGLAAPPAAFQETGIGLLLAEYRGYFGNPGRPTEAGLAADARAFFKAAAEVAGGEDRVVIAGHSLGGGVAIGLAADRTCAGVLTVATFTATTAVAPWIVSPLVPDRFANIDTIAAVRAPILIAHGDADTVIPFAMGEALRDRSDALAKPGAFLRLPGVGHSPGAARMRRMLATSVDALDAGRAAAFTDGASGAAAGFGPWRSA